MKNEWTKNKRKKKQENQGGETRQQGGNKGQQGETKTYEQKQKRKRKRKKGLGGRIYTVDMGGKFSIFKVKTKIKNKKIEKFKLSNYNLLVLF